MPPRTLDLGCASGAYVRLLERAGHRAVGLDDALAHLARARAAPGRGLFVAGEAYALNGASITARALHSGDDLRGRALRHALHRPASVRRCLTEESAILSARGWRP